MSDLTLFDYATKWYVLAPALIVLYAVYIQVYNAYLIKKLGAAKEANCEGDGLFGFRLPFWLIERKENGTVVDYVAERFDEVLSPGLPLQQLTYI